MTTNTMTYAQLTEKLTALGYKQVRMTLDGKPARIYEHQKIEDATMFLPDAEDQEAVSPVLMAKALLILRTYGIIEGKTLVDLERRRLLILTRTSARSRHALNDRL